MKRLQNIKYINDDEQNGIDYDWKLIKKMYKELNCPDDIFDPTTNPIETCRYIHNLSIRSTGKTTGWVLIGMIMNALYGTTVGYVRQSEEETAPKYARELMNVIVGYEDGRYIRQITDDRYNTVRYKDRRLFYALVDENGKEIERAPECFLILLCIDMAEIYKSTLNVFRCDLFIVDEYVKQYYRDGAYINFMQLVSTVKRRRKSMRIVLLANTIRYTSQWYREFMIQNELKKLNLGDHRTLVTPKGTRIYIELVEPKAKQRILEDAELYFGFDNPELMAIVGTDVAWTMPMVPRISYQPDDRIITKRIRVAAEDELKMVLVFNKEVGLHVNVYPATTKRHDDEYLLTLNTPECRRDLFGLGAGDIFRKIWELYKKNLFFYSDNETGAVLMDYFERAKDAIRKRM